MKYFLTFALIALLGASAGPQDAKVPRFSHIFVIMEENKDYGQIIGSPDAPTITALGKRYGYATQFYAETHPSQPNYVALIGGYTYGIRDDDAFYCHADDQRPYCKNSSKPGYVDHTVDRPSLASQLEAAGLTWKNYNEDLPSPGSEAIAAGAYAAKHSGFLNYASVQNDPKRAQKVVGFDQFAADLKSGDVPNFAFVIPDLCDEMHGMGADGTPADCRFSNMDKLIWRGDRNVKAIVGEIMATPIWRASSNVAIVVTFDEDDHYGLEGCCGVDANDPANRGGGHIGTIVITNHGPRGVVDATPYSHYSLLRTIEDAFGIDTHLARAAAPGVVPMVPLFAKP
ncbi:MAG TPA: alkaline phosphatase family protein [Verrucomicrobiae bacterium]|jgi:phospholipase C|nr:alkaline phosphatase family protein [Verrucomicrobiae bacterium]